MNFNHWKTSKGVCVYIKFSELKGNLTQDDVDQIVEIVGYRCRIKTIHRLRSILAYSSSLIPNHGIMDRLVKETRGWAYIAGQSYTDEIRTVRDIILNG